MDSNRFSDPSDDHVPIVIGHRGAAGHAPENTLPSLEAAHRLGAAWVEFDVKLSRDRIPILFHDDRLERTTDGHGPVADIDASALGELDAGSWYGPAFTKTPVPTLRAAIDLLSRLGMGANVEIKPSPGREVETGMIVGKALADEWPDDLPPRFVSSFSVAALQSCAVAAPGLKRALLVFAVPKDWRQQMQAVQTQTLHCLSRRLRERRAKEIIDTGTTLRCFTVNRPKRARQLLDWGVEGIISDYPDRISTIA